MQLPRFLTFSSLLLACVLADEEIQLSEDQAPWGGRRYTNFYPRRRFMTNLYGRRRYWGGRPGWLAAGEEVGTASQESGAGMGHAGLGTLAVGQQLGAGCNNPMGAVVGANMPIVANLGAGNGMGMGMPMGADMGGTGGADLGALMPNDMGGTGGTDMGVGGAGMGTAMGTDMGTPMGTDMSTPMGTGMGTPMGGVGGADTGMPMVGAGGDMGGIPQATPDYVGQQQPAVGTGDMQQPGPIEGGAQQPGMQPATPLPQEQVSQPQPIVVGMPPCNVMQQQPNVVMQQQQQQQGMGQQQQQQQQM